jgi:hypothetical protein
MPKHLFPVAKLCLPKPRFANLLPETRYVISLWLEAETRGRNSQVELGNEMSHKPGKSKEPSLLGGNSSTPTTASTLITPYTWGKGSSVPSC